MAELVQPEPDAADLAALVAGGHAWEAESVLAALGSDGLLGLGEAQSALRLRRFGPNELSGRRESPLWWRFLGQFNDPLLYALLITGAIKALIHSLTEALVIWSVTLINALIGFVQENKAETAIAALARSVRTETEVIRDGRQRLIPSQDLVVGDLVRLEAGARIPADLRLLAARNLQVDESALTGESIPVEKGVAPVAQAVALAERSDMAYAGSFVTAGVGCGVVVASGNDTEVGQISGLLRKPSVLTTPLTRTIRRFSRTLLQLILLLAGLTFAIGLMRGRGAAEMFDGAVALAVGAIPEELPAIVTITLAIGVGRMARRNAIIRKLPAVEALGSTTVICSDKTGTLTQNRMTVREIYAGGSLVAIEELWPSRQGGPDPLVDNRALQETLLTGLLCNDARLDTEGDLLGDPTEAALLVAAELAGLDRAYARDHHPRRDAIPFASEHQYMATLHGSRRILVKGAVEAVLPRCRSQLDSTGVAIPLDGAAVDAAVAAMAGRGLRVLAFAMGTATADQPSLDHHHIAGGLDFLGLQGMLDPPRPEAARAVAACHQAGITVKMITGDHLDTALAIARQIDLSGKGDAVVGVEGKDLAAMTPEALAACVDRTDVFARVAPTQKLELVRALQAHGAVVAMTGDGVNDAPALRQADIGIAMGRGGTEVARQAADMLLTDDDFASIEAAVEEGRGVYLNLRKTLAFILPVNGGASITILLAAVLGLELPVTALQVLWLNMISSLTMSVPLAFEPKPAGLMVQPPRPPGQPLLTPRLIRRVMLVSLFNWGLVFSVFFGGKAIGADLDLARTMAVQALVLSQVVYLVSISQVGRGLCSLGAGGWQAIRQAPALLLGVSVGLLFQFLFSQASWMNTFFGTAPLGLREWGICALPMLAMLPVSLLAQRLDPTSAASRS